MGMIASVLSLGQRLLDRLGEILALLILAFQLVGVLRSPFVADRFFSWAPHDQRVEYRISAREAGVPVEKSEIYARYGLPSEGRNWHAYGDILKVIEVVESRKPQSARWDVRVDYEVNLGPTQSWLHGRNEAIQ